LWFAFASLLRCFCFAFALLLLRLCFYLRFAFVLPLLSEWGGSPKLWPFMALYGPQWVVKALMGFIRPLIALYGHYNARMAM
jgi:hypothetical protein